MSKKKLQLFRKIIAESGHRNTRAREQTFNMLLTGEPQSMQELIAKAKDRLDRASVYRNIELFEDLGIARRIYQGWKYKIELSEAFVGHHHHISCRDCGSVQALPHDEVIEQRVKALAAEQGFNTATHVFEVEGSCGQCPD